MDLPKFRAAVADATTLLKALQTLLPDRVEQELIDYLDAVQESPVGLELLRNAIEGQRSG